jgi:hypothetical protein
MISLQPFYIQGIRVKQAKESAFGAAGLFIVTFIASICWVYAERTRRAPDIVHAIDGEHDNYDDDPEEEHPSLHYSAAAEYDGESEYVRRAMVMSRTALRRFRQQRLERQQHQQRPTASIAAISLEMKSFEIRSRPSSSNAATNSGELL